MGLASRANAHRVSGMLPRFRAPSIARGFHAAVMFCVLCGLALLAPVLRAGERVILNFNPDWKFLKADPAGAQQVAFDDHDWVNVATPHTFNDIDTFDNWSTPGHRGEQIQWSGRTWYRKHFRLPESARGKKVYIEFEAARQVAEVYCNGVLLGVAKTGFTPFGFDLTPHLKFGAENVIAVMVDNRFMKDPLDAEAAAAVGAATGTSGGKSAANPNLLEMNDKINEAMPENIADLQADQIPWNNPHWHPAHGGLYRNVHLYITDPLHIALPLYSFLQTAGPYVYATNVTAAAARIGVEVPVQNQRSAASPVEVRAELFDADGKSVLALTQIQTVPVGGTATFQLAGALPHPHPWEPGYPYIYRVVCALRVGGEVIDTSEVSLGVRTARWDTNHGFFLNGNHVKLHGWGQKPTDEWAGLGAAQPDWMHEYTLQLMQEAGGNFVRWGHSATGLASITAGDRLGIIALQPGTDGEHDTVGAAWKLRAIAFRDTIIYFRNHPSILIWEGGNQKVSRDHARELRGYMDLYDPHGGRVYAHRRADAITAEFMDIGIGTEGGREIATLPVVEGEYDREESPRRVWDKASPPNFGYPEAKGMTYDLTSEEYAVNQVGQYIKKLGPAWHSGGANWIFSDTTSGGRVPAEVDRAGGEVDAVRLPKEAYHVIAAMFRSDPQVYIIGHWTYPAGTKKNIYVASNAADVELLLNGRSLGHGHVSDQYLFTFPDVTWEPGELKAVARTKDQIVATDARHTVGAPAALRLTVHTGPGGLRADGGDIALIDVEAVDAHGDRCPTFQQRADFATSGPAIWRGGYNSGKINSTNNTYLDLEAGINRVAVRATRTAGAITVRATSAGLAPASVSFSAQPFAAPEGMTTLLPATAPHPLPAAAPAPASAEAAPAVAAAPGQAAGKYITAMNYTGPTAAIVRVATGARDGLKIYGDRDYIFADLPAALVGADWVMPADADARYSAVDLIELAVKAGTTVYIAHDERVAVPSWLSRQFEPAGFTLQIHAKPMRVFQRRVDEAGSLTFGSNTDEPRPKASNQYVVLVSAASGATPAK